MKKVISKVLCIITALCVFLGTMPLVSYANEDVTYISGAGEDVSVIEISPEAELPVIQNVTASKFYGNSLSTDVDASKYFYSQLTATQKAIYDQILGAGITEQIEVDISASPCTGTGTSSSAAESAASSQLKQDVIMALSALPEDNPMYFWVSGFGYGYNGTMNVSGSTYTCKLTTIIVAINLNETHFADWTEVQTKHDAVVEAVENFKVNGISRFEKVKSIHDTLCDSLTYDTTIAEPNIFDPYGALVNGLCVCEGYAEAMKLICDREGIPCLTVVGTGNGGAHKWNYVQMDDGNWYLIDATWDDQTSYTFYSYFIIGSSAKAPYFSSSDVADSTIHIPSGTIYSSATTALTYPTLATANYGITFLYPNAGDIAVDNNRNCILVGKGITNYVSCLYNSGDYSRSKSGSGTTGTTVTVSDSTNSKIYTVAMRGDINASNTVTTDDYSLVVSTAVAQNEVAENTAKHYAGDMTQDGAIDGFDAIALDLYIDGTLTFE